MLLAGPGDELAGVVLAGSGEELASEDPIASFFSFRDPIALYFFQGLDCF